MPFLFYFSKIVEVIKLWSIHRCTWYVQWNTVKSSPKEETTVNSSILLHPCWIEECLSFPISCYVQVTQSGWSEGECQGRAGWFPSEYVEKRQRVPTSNGATEVYWKHGVFLLLVFVEQFPVHSFCSCKSIELSV